VPSMLGSLALLRSISLSLEPDNKVSANLPWLLIDLVRLTMKRSDSASSSAAAVTSFGVSQSRENGIDPLQV
jgi:hypothetical protein